MPIDLTELLKGNELVRGRTASPPVAVLTMELQRGVMGDLASFPQLAAAADEVGVPANAGRLLDAARLLDVPVIHCTAAFRADRAGTVINTPLHSAVLRRADHLLEGSPAVELIPELGPDPSDLVVARYHGVSPFAGTSLDAALRNLGVSTVIVTGVSLNLGVLGLCVEAANLGYQLVVATDAVCGVPEEYGRRVLAETIGLLASLATVDEIIGALTPATTLNPDIV